MKRKTEKELAIHSLVHHKLGYSIWYVLKKSKVMYTAHILLTVLLGAGFFCLENEIFKTGMLFSCGMMVGAISRDAGWLRGIKIYWPFTEKVTDWNKVREIAEGDI